MLKTILSVSGKPGLFKLISSGKNMVIVESLIDKKRLPIYARDKVVSLGDIAMYTDEDEVPLQKVLTTIQKKENGAQASIDPKSKPEELRKYFLEILPNYDRERVYDTDIKKLISWYNLLIKSEISFDKMENEELAETAAESAEELLDESPAPKEKAPKKVKIETEAEDKPKKKAPVAKAKKKEEE